MKMLIMGPPDVGKTRSASFWPKPIFADCEDGRMSLADRKVPYGRIRSTADMDALINQLAFDNKKPADKRKYQTLVVDTIDHYQKIAISERLRKEGKEALSGWADWGWLDGHMQQFVEKLLNLEMNIIVNVHYKTITESGDDDDKTKNVYQALRLKGDVKDWLLEEFDLIGMMESTYKATAGERVRSRHIRWHNEPAYPLLKDRSGSLPRFTDIDFTENDYTRIFEALMSKVDDLPESQQVEEIEVPEEPEPMGPDETGGPVDPGKLPEKPAPRRAVKKATGKRAEAKAAPGVATASSGLLGTKDEPAIVDANKVDLAKAYHVHDKSGVCLKNNAGELCEKAASDAKEPTGATEGDSSSVTEAPLADEYSEPSTPVEESPAEEKHEDPAVELAKGELGGEVVSEEPTVRPERYCGLQPDSHKKFPAVDGCGSDLAQEIPAKVNLALLRTKTLLCSKCFDAWKQSQTA